MWSCWVNNYYIIASTHVYDQALPMVVHKSDMLAIACKRATELHVLGVSWKTLNYVYIVQACTFSANLSAGGGGGEGGVALRCFIIIIIMQMILLYHDPQGKTVTTIAQQLSMISTLRREMIQMTKTDGR